MHVRHVQISVRTGPGYGTGSFWSDVASVQSQNIFWTRRDACTALEQDM